MPKSFTQISEHAYVKADDVAVVMRGPAIGKSVVVVKGFMQGVLSDFNPLETVQLIQGEVAYEQLQEEQRKRDIENAA